MTELMIATVIGTIMICLTYITTHADSSLAFYTWILMFIFVLWVLLCGVYALIYNLHHPETVDDTD